MYFFYLFFDKIALKGTNPPPYGIRMYVGLPGTGKTVSMVEYLIKLRANFPDIKIYTNFGFKYEDGEINSLDDFSKINHSGGVVFAVDEVQLSFQSRKFNTFPAEMIFLLTQNRKFKKHFVCTAQLFEHVDKIFRDLTNEVVQCRNLGKRWFFQKAYITLDYKSKYNPDSDKLPFVSWRYSFVANSFIFNAFDTFKIVESFQKEKAQDRAEAVSLLEGLSASLSNGKGGQKVEEEVSIIKRSQFLVKN